MAQDAINYEAMLSSFDGDREFCLEILQDVEVQFVEKLKTAAELAARQDCEELSKLAHSLKGAAMNIRADRLVASMEALESAARQGQADRLETLFAEGQKTWGEVQAALESIRSGS